MSADAAARWLLWLTWLGPDPSFEALDTALAKWMRGEDPPPDVPSAVYTGDEH